VHVRSGLWRNSRSDKGVGNKEYEAWTNEQYSSIDRIKDSGANPKLVSEEVWQNCGHRQTLSLVSLHGASILSVMCTPNNMQQNAPSSMQTCSGDELLGFIRLSRSHPKPVVQSAHSWQV
jgi:hypothetical protein